MNRINAFCALELNTELSSFEWSPLLAAVLKEKNKNENKYNWSIIDLEKKMIQGYKFLSWGILIA